MAEQQRSREEIAKEWVSYSIADWQKRIKQLKITDTEHLYGSFVGDVINKAAGSLEITIAYAWYGHMIDAGYGRGYGATKRTENADMRRLLGKDSGIERKPRPWLTSGKRTNIAAQTHRLAELVGEAAVRESVDVIVNNLAEEGRIIL